MNKNDAKTLETIFLKDPETQESKKIVNVFSDEDNLCILTENSSKGFLWLHKITVEEITVEDAKKLCKGK